MSEKRLIYVEQIISELKSLEKDLLAVKNNDTLPFSFFKESFNKTQNISRLLHKLEFFQVDEMKEQMERLVRFLSETETKESSVKAAEPVNEEKPVEVAEPIVAEEKPVFVEEKPIVEDKEPEVVEIIPEVVSEEPVEVSQKKHPIFDVENSNIAFPGNTFAKGVELPEYKKQHTSYTPQVQQAPKVHNDIAIEEMKRGISINDRFLFQRELFNNNRAEMDETFRKLNSFESFDEAENYLKESRDWNFDNATVTDFLLIIKNRFN